MPTIPFFVLASRPPRLLRRHCGRLGWFSIGPARAAHPCRVATAPVGAAVVPARGELQGRSPLGRIHLLCHRCGNRVGRPRGFPDRSRAVATGGRSLTPPIFGRAAVGAACWGSGSVEPASSPRRLGRFGCLAQTRARRRARLWWPPLSDTGSESAGGGAAASLLAGFGRVASTGRIELPRGVLAVALRAFRALRV